jgi:hypothetical protein
MATIAHPPTQLCLRSSVCVSTYMHTPVSKLPGPSDLHAALERMPQHTYVVLHLYVSSLKKKKQPNK